MLPADGDKERSTSTVVSQAAMLLLMVCTCLREKAGAKVKQSSTPYRRNYNRLTEHVRMICRAEVTSTASLNGLGVMIALGSLQSSAPFLDVDVSVGCCARGNNSCGWGSYEHVVIPILVTVAPT